MTKENKISVMSAIAEKVLDTCYDIVMILAASPSPEMHETLKSMMAEARTQYRAEFLKAYKLLAGDMAKLAEQGSLNEHAAKEPETESSSEEKPNAKAAKKAKPDSEEEDMEKLRIALADKVQEGKSRQVRLLLKEFGAGRLSDLKPEFAKAALEKAVEL